MEISGSTVIVGAYYCANDVGRVYVFTKQGTKWPQVADLEASDPDDREWSVLPTVSPCSPVRGGRSVAYCAGPSGRPGGRTRTNERGTRPFPDAQIGVATPERAKGLDMIEVASEPADLSSWDGDDPPFYLEIFGETSPALDTNYAEVVPPNGSGPESTSSSPVYEYWWTMGHPGLKPEHHHLINRPKNEPIWSHLAEDAAHVYLFFPIDYGWRVKEVVATVKYLSPVQDQQSLSERANTEWQKMQPLVADAGTLTSVLAPVPAVGAAAAATSSILTALSKLQIGSVPPSAAGYNWYVEKVTTGAASKHGVMQGVMWSIPRTMFESLGGRLTGSLAVSFIPNKLQGSADWAPKSGDLVAHAGVFEKAPFGKEEPSHWVPSQSTFVHLSITPH